MILRWAIAVSMLAALLAMPASAGAHTDSNFTESEACGPAGFRGPLGSRGGWLPTSEEVFGPFADFFGRDFDQVESAMVRWTVPGSGGRSVLVHELALPAFNQVSANLAAEAAAGRTYRVDEAYGWAFRAVTGSSHRMSFHAFGIAVDINPRRNPFIDDPEAPLITDMPQWYVKAWEDAGFCWGGRWLSKRDAMHFSWKGPTFTPGYGTAPAPSPYTRAASNFTESVFAGTLPTGRAAGWNHAVDDRSRDGAPDVYSWRWLEPGMLRVEVSGAYAGFRYNGLRAEIALDGGPDTHQVVFADYDGDNRADLWTLDNDTGALEVRGDTVEGSTLFEETIAAVATGVTGAERLLVADYNRDLVPDLYAVGPDGRLRVFDGASGFTTELVALDLGPLDSADLALDDLTADGHPDLYLIGSEVRVLLGAFGYAEGPVVESTAVPARGSVQLGDYDGDGHPDIYHFDDGLLSVFLGGEPRPGLDSWFRSADFTPWDAGPECRGPQECDQIGFVDQSSEFNLRDNLAWWGGAYNEFFFGMPGDVPLVGDWDCDGIASPGMFRPSTGYAYLSNINETGVAEIEYFFGVGGDIPLAGDWDGDGCDTLSIYRPSESRVYISNVLDTAFAETSYFFGVPGDRPFTGDFDGDGVDDVGLYRGSNGFVYFRLDHSSGVADREFFYGQRGDKVIAGDWDGDGDDTVAIFREAEGRWYFRLDNSLGVADHVLRAGPVGQPITPVVGAFGEISGG